jgi:hypothetical protein
MALGGAMVKPWSSERSSNRFRGRAENKMIKKKIRE